MARRRIAIGTAGWSIQARWAPRLPGDGTHLERYGRILNAVEINSSFYRPHRRTTYARWAASVPSGFRFAVKVPREITHRRRLVGCDDLLDAFLGQATGLADRLGPLLVQLPPSLAFDAPVASRFFEALGARHNGPVVCEPRHQTWLSAGAERLLHGHAVARVAADPAPVSGAGEPGGWPGLVYLRLHGAPRIYRSDYDDGALDAIAARLRRAAADGVPAWCIFDNTADFAALGNALSLASRLDAPGGSEAQIS